MINRNDSILVFEYFTASGEKDKCIISEAESLIFSLLNDLSEFNVDLVINKDYKDIVNSYNNVNPILIDEDVIDWLEVNASDFNNAIFIAAENNNNLYRITRILEDNEVNIYNSSSEACFKSSDKYETYCELLNIVPQPKSFKYIVDNGWKNVICDLFDKWNSKLIVKPLSGVDCENILVFENIDDYDVINSFPIGSEVLIQEFIDGEDVSVSLITDDENIYPISLNKQFIDIKEDRAGYIGGKLPYKHKSQKKAFEVAVKALKSINGMKGFVGVDLLISRKDSSVYLLEINSRFTTPYVGLTKVSNINIVETIIKLIDGKTKIDDVDISLDGEIEFKKVKNSLEIRRL